MEYLISLGANIKSRAGSPAQTIVESLRCLRINGLTLRCVSRFFATECFPKGAGPDFVNVAASFCSSRTPDDVLSIFHEIELKFGRKRTHRWSARTLDIDLIASGDLVCPGESVQNHWRNLTLEDQKKRTPHELILPHPRLQDRAFVLVPLAEIQPQWRHPILDRTVKQMCDALPKADLEAVGPI